MAIEGFHPPVPEDFAGAGMQPLLDAAPVAIAIALAAALLIGWTLSRRTSRRDAPID